MAKTPRQEYLAQYHACHTHLTRKVAHARAKIAWERDKPVPLMPSYDRMKRELQASE